MMKFKIGDKVSCIRGDCIISVGIEGIITSNTATTFNNEPYIVDFKNGNTEIHSPENALELIPKKITNWKSRCDP